MDDQKNVHTFDRVKQNGKSWGFKKEGNSRDQSGTKKSPSLYNEFDIEKEILKFDQ